MEGCSGKRAIDGLVVSKRSSGLVLRDFVNSKDRNAPSCNRIGCSSRLNSLKGTPNSSSDKAKQAKNTLRSSSSGKEIVGSSSRTTSTVSSVRKVPTNTRKKLSSRSETDSSESSTVQDEQPEVLEQISPPGKIQRGSPLDPKDSGRLRVTSNIRSQRTLNLNHRTGLPNQDALTSSTVSLSPGSTNQATRGAVSRYGLRNLRCSSISDVVRSGSPSSSDSSLNRKKDLVKKRNTEGEGSSSNKGKSISGPSVAVRNYNPTHGVSISDTRRVRNLPSNRETNVSSVRTRRPINNYNRTRLSSQGNRSSSSRNESPVVISNATEPEASVDLDAPISSEIESHLLSSYSSLNSSGDRLRGILQATAAEADFTSSLMNRDSFRRYNIDGIAEVLLALERIEQDEELTYEQLLVLESNLYHNGLNYHDQHREMRLDIDNMSYEELLALEDRMGNVSTALTEEALSNSIKTSIYQSTYPKDASICCSENKDDVKCSICQEEYVVKEEVGSLRCEHRYHATCINQWLRLKNWCPICKASAEAAP